MTTNNALPNHLERIGDQLIVAAENLYASSPGESRLRALPRRALATLARAPRLALASSVAGLAAAAAVVAVFAASAAPPAYALTQNANGTYTITINDIATGVPALNAKLKQLGIDTTAVPVTTTCTAPDGGLPLVGGWSSPTMSQTITLDQANIPAGYRGVIAAYQSPSGQVDLTIATTSGSIPSCLNANDISTASTSNPTTNQR